MTFHRIRCGWRRMQDAGFMEEDLIPKENGAPNLNGFRKPLASYVEMLDKWAEYLSGADHSAAASARAYKNLAYGQWGLIAKGEEAIPYALTILRSKIPEFREAAASILATAGKDPSAVASVVRAAEAETDPVALAGLMEALGKMGSREAIPFLARTLREGDADARWDAAESLSKIVGKRFGNGTDRVANALAWLGDREI